MKPVRPGCKCRHLLGCPVAVTRTCLPFRVLECALTSVCVCEEKRVLVLMQDTIQACWYAVRNLTVKPTRRTGGTHSLVDLLGYNLFSVYNCLFNVGAGALTKTALNQNQQLLNKGTIVRRGFSSKSKSFYSSKNHCKLTF